MRTKVTIQKSIFKHLGQWHILPTPKIVIEPFKSKYAITFEITFLPYTAFLTIWIILNEVNFKANVVKPDEV